MWENHLVRFSYLAGLALFFCLPAQATDEFRLSDPGREAVVHYDHYGRFANIGTPQYQYLINDREGLSKAVGEGIYPNVSGLLKDPGFPKSAG